ncbi:MAG: hypothetical protein JST90_15700 [Bacteroidetes bacterium]|nr:hypothetical protein [Bacteroidota bacterium]
MIYVNTYLKHLLCLSLTAVLLLGGQACKKTVTTTTADHHVQDSIARADSLAASDFRTAFTGMYAGDVFNYSSGPPGGGGGTYTFLYRDTFEVTKVSGDSIGIAVDGNTFSNISQRDSAYISYSGNTMAQFRQDSVRKWHLYYIFNFNGSGIHPDYDQVNADKIR